MIITRLQNYIKPNTNSSVKPIPTSFTSKSVLNRDIFVPHDENNATQQYLNTYEPGKTPGDYYVTFYDFNRSISELNSDSPLDYNWIFRNSHIIRKVFGMELPRHSEASKIFISELNSNRSKIGQNIIDTFRRELEAYYKNVFPMFNNPPEVQVKNFDSEAFQIYNLTMASLDYDNTKPENLSMFYRTKNGTQIKNPKVKDYIAEKLSQYGSTMPAEMFVEIGAKLIANSLDMRTLRPAYNPFAFKNFTQDKYLMQMMDDFYNGRFEKYL